MRARAARPRRIRARCRAAPDRCPSTAGLPVGWAMRFPAAGRLIPALRRCSSATDPHNLSATPAPTPSRRITPVINRKRRRTGTDHPRRPGPRRGQPRHPPPRPLPHEQPQYRGRGGVRPGYAHVPGARGRRSAAGVAQARGCVGKLGAICGASTSAGPCRACPARCGTTRNETLYPRATPVYTRPAPAGSGHQAGHPAMEAASTHVAGSGRTRPSPASLGEMGSPLRHGRDGAPANRDGRRDASRLVS